MASFSSSEDNFTSAELYTCVHCPQEYRPKLMRLGELFAHLHNVHPFIPIESNEPVFRSIYATHASSGLPGAPDLYTSSPPSSSDVGREAIKSGTLDGSYGDDMAEDDEITSAMPQYPNFPSHMPSGPTAPTNNGPVSPQALPSTNANFPTLINGPPSIPGFPLVTCDRCRSSNEECKLDRVGVNCARCHRVGRPCLVNGIQARDLWRQWEIQFPNGRATWIPPTYATGPSDRTARNRVANRSNRP